MLKRCILALFACMLVLNVPFCVRANVNVSAKSAIVIDMASNRVLFEKDAYTKRGPASTTKILTALLAIENVELNDMVTVSPHAAATEGSSIWLSPLEKISAHDLLYGLMLSSGNDAATALAEHVSGSEEAFVIKMNQRAIKIGAYNTNFTNPHGLPDENHYTTAYDLALISSAAMKNENFAEVVATKNKTISWEGAEWDRSLSNHNKLLKMYEYATGIKTGYTKKDGRCLVSAAEKNGLGLVAVTLSAPDDWNDHIAMLDYCFEQYEPYTVCKEGENAGVFAAKGFEADDIRLVYNNDYITALKNDESERLSIKKSFNFDYPVTRGQKVGQCDIYYLDEHVGSVDLIADNDSYVKENFITIIKKLTKGIMML